MDAIVCNGCRKQYKWKPELAGKKVKCKCGTVIDVPAQPQPPGPDEDDLYAFADDPSTGGPAAAVAAIPPIRPVPPPIQPVAPIPPIARPQAAVAGAAAARGAAPMLGYRPRASQQEIARGSTWSLEGSPIKDFWLPIGCIVVGLIINLVDWMVLNELDFIWAMLVVGVSTVIEMVVLIVGCVIAMKLMDMALGAPLQALLKIAGVAIAPGAIVGLLGSSFDGGWMVGWGVSFLLSIFLLMAFFDLDGTEVMILASIIWVMKQLGGYIVMFAIVGWLVSGAISGGGGGGSAVGGGGMGSMIGGSSAPQASAAELDAEARDWLEELSHAEAKQWLAAANQRLLDGLDRAKSVALVNQLYAAGATEVRIAGLEDGYPVADLLVVSLPKDSARRKKIFALEREFSQVRPEFEPTRDVGQNYLVLYFMD